MGYTRVSAFLLGFIIVVVGGMGFVPALLSNGQLFGLFAVSLVHNLLYITTGVIGIIAAIPNHRRYAAWYILELGLIYALVTVVGFVYDGNIFNLTYFNLNDNLLHAGITALAFILSILILLNRPQEYTGISLNEDAPQSTYR